MMNFFSMASKILNRMAADIKQLMEKNVNLSGRKMSLITNVAHDPENASDFHYQISGASDE